ncbi:MAG: hypothetical protein E5X62_17805 [Mesorhizobium sp.]|nr:MAG: hypothetical protein E5X62_17805 [Mesorhizobium sp.]
MGIPEKRRRGYPENVAIGSICVCGRLGVLIPPTIIFIFDGIATERYQPERAIMMATYPDAAMRFADMAPRLREGSAWRATGAPERRIMKRSMVPSGTGFMRAGVFSRHADQSASTTFDGEPPPQRQHAVNGRRQLAGQAAELPARPSPAPADSRVRAYAAIKRPFAAIAADDLRRTAHLTRLRLRSGQ